MEANVENPSPMMEIAGGSLPLANPKWEKYAQERALCSSRLLAFRAAGFKAKDDHAATGNAARLERNQQCVRDRIAWLCRQEEPILRAKRDKLEAMKWRIADVDIADYFVMVERPVLDKEGKQVTGPDGRPLTRMVQDVKPFQDMTPDQRSVIQSLKYTDSGRPILEFYSKQWADVELRKMLKLDVGPASAADEFGEMSLKELAQFIAREQVADGLRELLKNDPDA